MLTKVHAQILNAIIKGLFVEPPKVELLDDSEYGAVQMQNFLIEEGRFPHREDTAPVPAFLVTFSSNSQTEDGTSDVEDVGIFPTLAEAYVCVIRHYMMSRLESLLEEIDVCLEEEISDRAAEQAKGLGE